MQSKKINLVYFSATGSTEKILERLTQGVGEWVVKYNITIGEKELHTFPSTELTIFGIPVYAGRVPQIAIESLLKFKGENTPAIVVCVYGNRHFDDALLELQTLVVQNGFKVISAAAFIAQHTIFPEVAAGRPDRSDWLKIEEFARNSFRILENNHIPEKPLGVTGNFPYRKVARIPLKPRLTRSCTECGLCVKQCPAQAISLNNLRKIDKERCISCARCITVCPTHARKFGGLLYKIATWKFKKHYLDRREPYLVYNTPENI